MMRTRAALRCWLGLVLLAAMACGGSGKPIKVSGRVLLDGKPLPGATVTFTPAEGKGNIAAGRTDADGGFRLTTFNVDDGAVPGEYKITIDVTSTGGDEAVAKNPMQMSEQEKKDFFMRSSPKSKAAEAKKKKPESVVPAPYRDITKTPLKQRVPPDGQVEINLQSNAR
jgi:hypothetical protein